jgi:hypothetical protein
MRRILWISLVGGSLCLAADVTGSWGCEVETSAGSGTPSFTFKQEGENLTGSYSGQLGEAKVKGTLKGDKIEFSFQAGAVAEGATVTYSGTVDEAGKKMKGTAKLADFGQGTFHCSKK